MSQDPAPSPSSGGLRAFFAIVVILALAVGGFFAVRYFQPQFGEKPAPNVSTKAG